jgi:NitT/TauT family transport system substrate-binding protein
MNLGTFTSRRARFLAGVAVAPLLAVAACGGNEESSGSSGQGSEPGPVTMDVTISTHPLLDFSIPTFVGIEQGFFQECGVEIGDIVGSEGGGTTVRNVLTGGLDMGLVSFPSVIEANIAGAPLPIVEGGPRRVTSHTLVVAEDSPLQFLEEAVAQNATIGFTSPGSVTQALLSLTLQKEGVDPSTVDTRPTGGMGAGFTSAREGGFDVVSAIEPIFSKAGEGLRIIHRISDNVSKYQQMAWVVNPEFAEENPEAVECFLESRWKAVQWIADNPEDAAALWAEKAELTDEAAMATLQTMIDTGGVEAYYGTGFDQEAIELTLDSMTFLGSLSEDEVVPWDEILIQEYLPEDTERIDIKSLPNPEPK